MSLIREYFGAGPTALPGSRSNYLPRAKKRETNSFRCQSNFSRYPNSDFHCWGSHWLAQTFARLPAEQRYPSLSRWMFPVPTDAVKMPPLGASPSWREAWPISFDPPLASHNLFVESEAHTVKPVCTFYAKGITKTSLSFYSSPSVYPPMHMSGAIEGSTILASRWPSHR